MNTQSFLGNRRFEVISMLGRGGMGVVYQVLDRERQTRVAIKTLNQGGASELLRLKREFRALQELEHPNLIQLGELFEEEGRWFFTMELVDGEDFLSHVRRPDHAVPYHEERLRGCMAQLVDALDFLHDSGRVHRDIKPENVLVESSGRVVVLDFGLVFQDEPGQLSQAGYYPVGTAGYMAPEQAASLPVGPEADWYAIGVMLFESLTGVQPFTGAFTQVLVAKSTQTAPRVRELLPTAPKDLDELCAGLLEPEPGKRPTAPEILRVLRKGSVAATRADVSMSRKLPLFVGRDRELSWIVEGQASVSQEGFKARLVHGSSGVGKSELFRSAAREILSREPSALLLSGRCNERESLSYKAFDGVVDGLGRFLEKLSPVELASLLPRNLEPLVRVFPVLSMLKDFPGGAGCARLSGDLQEVRSQAFGALRELLTRISDRRPVMIILDDIQWVDEDSFKLLRALMHPPGAPAIFLMMGMRTPTESVEARDLVDRFCSHLPFVPDCLELGLLPPTAADELVRELLSCHEALVRVDSGQVKSISEESAGHPLFIHELVRHLHSGDAGRIHAELRLDDVLWSRICTLDEASRRLVELVSVSFGPLRMALAADVLGLNPAEVFRLASRLKILHLLRTSGPKAQDWLEPYHDRVREAVLTRSDPQVKLDWHRRVVVVLRMVSPVEPERIASHLEAIGANKEASRYFALAAENAIAALAFDRAAGLLAQAIGLLSASDVDEESDVLHALRIRMGDALSVAGRGREAAEALLSAVPGSGPSEAMELRRRAAEQMLISGFLDEGFKLSAQVLGSLGMKLPRTTWGAVLSLAWRRFLVRLRGTKYRQRDETQIARSELVRVDILHSISRGLTMTDHIRGADFNTRFLLAALRLGEPSRILTAMTIEANCASGMSPGSPYSVRILKSCDHMLAKCPSEVASVYLDAAHGIHHFMLGEWSVARDHFETCIDRSAGLTGMSWERGMVHFQLMWSLFYMGEFAEMQRRIPPLLQDARDRGDLFTVSGLILGLYNMVILDKDGPRCAQMEIDEVLERWTVQGYHLQHYWALLSRVPARLHEGRGSAIVGFIRNEWKSLKRSFLIHVPAIRVESLILLGRSILASALATRGVARRDWLAQIPSLISPLIHGKGEWSQSLGALIAAGWEYQSGREAQAMESLSKAIEKLDSAGMGLYSAAARIRLGRLEGGDSGAGLVDRGFGFFQRQGVRDPAGMLRVLAPGFDHE